MNMNIRRREKIEISTAEARRTRSSMLEMAKFSQRPLRLRGVKSIYSQPLSVCLKLLPLFLFLATACGQENSSAASASPTQAFVAGDFEDISSTDSDLIQVPIIVRDPFMMPADLSLEAHVVSAVREPEPERVHVAATVEAPNSTTADPEPLSEAPTPEAEPQSVPIIWPEVRLSGMLRDGLGRWAAVIDGNVIRTGEKISLDVSVARADQDGVVILHRSGATRRINMKDRRDNG